MKKILFLTGCAGFMLLAACNKNFLNVPTQGGSVSANDLATATGVQQLLVGAYHDLSGATLTSAWWSTSGTNWLYADATSGDAFVGGAAPDASGQPNLLAVGQLKIVATNPAFQQKWAADYDGISRANGVISTVAIAKGMTDAQKTDAIAEARFLRGHYHFDAKKMWNNVPYIDETVTNFKLPNVTDIWPMIEADFRWAFDNLPEIQPLVGQANKWAAASYLAKCYLFEKKYTAAQGLLDTIINHGGKNSQGVTYDLTPCFHDNFSMDKENNQESVFQIQFSFDYNSYGENANLGETGVGPAGLVAAYGFYKRPSFNLVNAFKTDVNGLPMLDASGNDTSNVTNMTNDMGVPATSAFTPYAGTVDPRLDWTVGRRGIPYLDWGVDPGPDWLGGTQPFGGPYLTVKNVYMQNDANNLSGSASMMQQYITFGYAPGNSATNYSIIRFADVLLWAAEAESEVGSLEKARQYVNRVRTRAMNGCQVMDGANPAANYSVSLYNNPWTDQSYARNAIRFERRLELAMEGHRFFDLVRWGIAPTNINAFLSTEQSRLQSLSGVSFTQGKNEYFPIPQQEVDLSNQGGTPLLKQNPGY